MIDLINEEGNNLTIIIYSSQSDAFKRQRAKAVDKSLQRQGTQTSASKIAAEAATNVVSCVKSLSGFDGEVDFGQTAKTINMDTLKSVFMEVDWFKDQIDSAIANLSLFQQPSLPTRKKS